MQNERMLLNSLLGKFFPLSNFHGSDRMWVLLVTIYKVDPDILIGHDFLGVSLDVLLRRLKDLKAEQCTLMGAFQIPICS